MGVGHGIRTVVGPPRGPTHTRRGTFPCARAPGGHPAQATNGPFLTASMVLSALSIATFMPAASLVAARSTFFRVFSSERRVLPLTTGFATSAGRAAWSALSSASLHEHANKEHERVCQSGHGRALVPSARYWAT